MVQLHAPAKVTDFDDIPVLNEYVLWFDVSMNKTLLVHVVDATANLYEKVEGCVLG